MPVRLRPALLAAALLAASGHAAAQAAPPSPSPWSAAAEAPSTEPRDPTAPDPAPVREDLRETFEAFGGKPGLDALMEEFMAVMLEDPRMRPFFEAADQERVKAQLSLQFCAILGGGCTYAGRDMRSSHAELGITRADFNALVEDLQIAMERRGIPFRHQNRLLAVLAPMHREIVTQ